MAKNSLQKQETQTAPAQAEYTQATCFTPRVDIVETDNELLLFADMPGVKPDDIEVRFENGELALHGRCASSNDGRSLLAAEYGIGDYYRAFTVSQDIDADKISAELKQGVLTLRLPKAEAVKPKKIRVQGS